VLNGTSSAPAAAAAPPLTLNVSSGALEGETVVRVAVPILSARRTMKLANKATMGEVRAQLLTTYTQLDTTSVMYGVGVTDEHSGYVAAADLSATIASLNVKDGATLVFGPLEHLPSGSTPASSSSASSIVTPAPAATAAGSGAGAGSAGASGGGAQQVTHPVAVIDSKFATSRWATADWNNTAAQSDKLLVSVEHVAAGVTKLVQWSTAKRVSEVLAEFCEKVAVSPPSDYALFYVPHGLPPLYEIQMARDEVVGTYENNLLLATVIFRRL